MNAITSIGTTLTNAVNNIILFLPQFISGLIILIVGIIVANIASVIIEKGANWIQIGRWLQAADIEQGRSTRIWVNILSQIVYWFILLSFLIPTFEAWNLPAITNILNRFIFYLPNIFAAVIIGFAGIILTNISYQAITGIQDTISKHTVSLIANLTRYTIIFFTALIALNQLGISPNLIQIILTGFVATFAIAVGLGLGLSIGLGGRETVRHTLDDIVENNRFIGIKGGMAKRTPHAAKRSRENANKHT